MHKNILKILYTTIIITVFYLKTSNPLWSMDVYNSQLNEISAKTHLRIHAADSNAKLKIKKINNKNKFEICKKQKTELGYAHISIPQVNEKLHQKQYLPDPYPEMMPKFEYLESINHINFLLGVGEYYEPYEPLYNGFKHNLVPDRPNEDELPLQPPFEYCVVCGVAWEFLKQRKYLNQKNY
jgi:hypothetical protein